MRTAVATAVAALGGLDVLVYAAGILRSSDTHSTTLEQFQQVINVNLVGTFLMIREAIPALLEGNGAAVVNFSSTSAAFPHPYMAAYAASKGGLVAMLASEDGAFITGTEVLIDGGIHFQSAANAPSPRGRTIGGGRWPPGRWSAKKISSSRCVRPARGLGSGGSSRELEVDCGAVQFFPTRSAKQDRSQRRPAGAVPDGQLPARVG